MNFSEALHALADGKKITNINWHNKDHHWVINESKIVDNDGDDVILRFGEQDGWEVYEEAKPKRTVTLWQRPWIYILEDMNGWTELNPPKIGVRKIAAWFLTKELFSEEFPKAFGDWESIDIEVEE